MAKKSGLGGNFYVAGYDLSGDAAAIDNVRGGPTLQDITGIDKSAYERIGTVRDGEISWTTWFNDAAGQEHVALKGLPTADIQVMYFQSTTLGDQVAAHIAKQINYDWTRGADASLQGTVQSLSNGFGLQWGRSLTAGKRTDTGATNGTSIDDGTDAAPSTFGLTAFLQVFTFVGTNATVKLQESSDNAVGDPFADVTGGGFTQITAAPTTERIVTGLTLSVERYLRCVTTTAGGFTSMIFAVAVGRHMTAVTY